MTMCDIAGCGKQATIKCNWTVTIPQSGNFCNACNMQLWEQLKGLIACQKCEVYIISPICDKVKS